MVNRDWHQLGSNDKVVVHQQPPNLVDPLSPGGRRQAFIQINPRSEQTQIHPCGHDLHLPEEEDHTCARLVLCCYPSPCQQLATIHGTTAVRTAHTQCRYCCSSSSIILSLLFLYYLFLFYPYFLAVFPDALRSISRCSSSSATRRLTFVWIHHKMRVSVEELLWSSHLCRDALAIRSDRYHAESYNNSKNSKKIRCFRCDLIWKPAASRQLCRSSSFSEGSRPVSTLVHVCIILVDESKFGWNYFGWGF